MNPKILGYNYFILNFFPDFIFENRNIYKIGRIPAVLNIASAINHIRELFLADFHSAINFQIASQTIMIIKNHKGIPNEVAIKEK